ncbi:MAG TPA: hypothetical protein VF297_17370 [Pyrinomonadaceae bacterium]
MQTFASKLARAESTPGGNPQQLKQTLHDNGAPGAEPGVAQDEMLRALSNRPQAQATARHQELFDNSPRVASLAAYQQGANSGPAAVAQAKFRNSLHGGQVAQLKPGTSTPGAVIQRNGDDKPPEPSWMDKIKEKLPWAIPGGFLAFNRAVINQSAEPLNWFGKEQAAGSAMPDSQFGMKGYRLLQNIKKIRAGGTGRYLAMAPAALTTGWLASQMYKKYNEKRSNEIE